MSQQRGHSLSGSEVPVLESEGNSRSKLIRPGLSDEASRTLYYSEHRRIAFALICISIPYSRPPCKILGSLSYRRLATNLFLVLLQSTFGTGEGQPHSYDLGWHIIQGTCSVPTFPPSSARLRPRDQMPHIRSTEPSSTIAASSVASSARFGQTRDNCPACPHRRNTRPIPLSRSS
jgi:hypothetical protein